MKQMENGRKTRITVMGALLLPVIIIGIASMIVLQLMEKGSLTVFGGTIGIFIMMAIAAGVLSVLAKRLTDGIQDFTNNLDQVADEKLAVKEKNITERENELGEILRSMNCMAGSLASVVTGVKQASVSLREISEDFTQSFQEMAASVEQAGSEMDSIGENADSQAEQVREFHSQIIDINRSVDGILEHAEILEEAEAKMQEYSENTGRLMEELVEISAAEGQKMNEIQKQAETASQSAEQVRAVGEMIAGISGQANLAALNASIEAARAGKMGGGFASVADDIRTFADQSREAAEKISVIVEELTEKAGADTEVSQKAAEAYEKQEEKILQVKEMFASLHQELQQISAAAGGMAEQAAKMKGSEEIFDTDIVTLPEPVQEKSIPEGQIDHIGNFKITDFRK